MEMERVVADLVQTFSERYYGKYPGSVVDNADPKKLARLKLNIPSVMGEEVSGWAFPCLPYGGDVNQGALFIPEIGANVWVEFVSGNLESPIWVGTYWSEPGGESELPKPNNPDGSEQDSVQDPPTRKIIKTKNGHTIQFEDLDNPEDDFILIAFKIADDKTNTIMINKDGIKLTDSKENCIEMKEDAFTVTSKVPFSIDASGQPIEIKADTVDFTKA